MMYKNRGMYGVLGPSWVLITLAPRCRENAITGAHSNQDQIWCVNIREYMVFRSNRGF